MSKNEKPEQVAVVGLGLLGRGIAACLLGRGLHVVGVETGADQLAKARAEIQTMMDELVDLGGADAGLRDEWHGRYTGTTDFAALRESVFIVESVTEDAAVKNQVMDAIESVAGEQVVIASNTSAIPISLLQRGRKHPGRFVGMHWASPAHATRFMEIIRGEQTTDEAVAATAEMARRLGKDPCPCQRDMPGFIVNRIAYAMYREALNLLESGMADAETIDAAVRNGLGLWASLCGPLRWIDISGGPELYAKAMSRVLPTLSKADAVPAPLQELADANARGTINGRGFYSYTDEEARRWEDLYRLHAWRIVRMQNENAAT
ncbi:MAG: 3-hydroxyacyl-CoA dehydrogenase family protein [Verrucomicrobiaceae bacterium]|nr:3-hydroxyacyl-CoA dehydrogenase family protein [Verrucomicrobiaceae bacterium]